MKWLKFGFALALLSMAACVSSTGPQFPQDGEDDGQKGDPNRHGLVISLDEGFLV